MTNEDKALIKAKRIECCLGFFFLIPPILGVLSFVLCLFGCRGDFVTMRNLSSKWSMDYGDGGGAMSAAPIYLALMAMVGAYLVKDSIKYLFIKEEEIKKQNAPEFYGAKLGTDSAEVRKQFARHNLMLVRASKDYSVFHFEKRPDCYEEYLNVAWKMVDALFDNDKFYSIRYMNSYTTKEQALIAFEDAKTKINVYYELKKLNPPTSDLIVMYGHKTQQGLKVLLGCSQYTSTTGKELYNVKLEIGI